MPRNSDYSHLQAILESISDGVFTVDRQWQVTSFNRAAQEITGISRDDAVGRQCADVFRANMCETDCALRHTMETSQPLINRLAYIINAAGERIPISISTAILKDSRGRIIGGAETFRDLSMVEELQRKLSGRYLIGDIITTSPAMRRIIDILPPVAKSGSNVLITGDTGTGKELLARALHGIGKTSKEPFVAVNCAALPENLLESELFGYVPGAFTGADRNRTGRFSEAGKGTIFLDEIGEISPALQVKLLRVLQERVFEPLGTSKSKPVQARIITATNRDLPALVEDGLFRQDLFYRINVVRMDLPPLRKRREDIPLLIEHFLSRFNHQFSRNILGLAPEALSLLYSHDFPGNIRELENIIEYSFIMCRGNLIKLEHLPDHLRPGERGLNHLNLGKPGPERISSGQFSPACIKTEQFQPGSTTLDDAEKHAIIDVLKRNNGNCLAAARELGIHKTTLYRKIRKHGISLPSAKNKK